MRLAAFLPVALLVPAVAGDGGIWMTSLSSQTTIVDSITGDVDGDGLIADNEARAPQITRVKMSRPTSSVPNQCVPVGALRIALQLASMGSNGEMSGAKIAIAIKSSTT